MHHGIRHSSAAITAAVLILTPLPWTGASARAGGPHYAPAPARSGTSAWGHPGKADAVDRTIRIKAEDSMRFVPARLSVEAGQTVKFVITNEGKLRHELVLGPKSEQREHESEMQAMARAGKTRMGHSDPNEVALPPGATRTLVWTFTRPGTYQYACHEPGHYAAGMVGTLTVTARKP